MMARGLALVAAAALSLAAGSVLSEARAGCVKAGGTATMVTQGLSEFMANAALKNSISGMGAKGVGKIDMKCSTEILTTCTAHQRACK